MITDKQCVWYFICAILYVALFCLMGYLMEGGSSYDINKKSYFRNLLKDYNSILSISLSLVIMFFVHRFGDENWAGYMRPEVKTIYEDFRENPKNWHLNKGGDWKRENDGFRIGDPVAFIYPNGYSSAVLLSNNEVIFFEEVIDQRKLDKEGEKYKEFKDFVKGEKNVKLIK